MNIYFILSHPFDVYYGERKVILTLSDSENVNIESVLGHFLNNAHHFRDEVTANGYLKDRDFRVQIALNGKLLSRGEFSDRTVKDGDTITMFQMFAGG